MGYYQLTYQAQPYTHYFGHLIAFAQSRDGFQQLIERYQNEHKCALKSQLAPLPATTWFQRHGQHAGIFHQAQTLKQDELRFLLAQEETQSPNLSYLNEESVSVSPFVSGNMPSSGPFSYLPEKLATHPFFTQLNAQCNPKEGLIYPNPTFVPNADDFRYYAVIDAVKSWVLPQLSAHEGQTDSLYKGELKDKMERHAPYLTQLTVTDAHTSPFVQLLFTQSETNFLGAWNQNPAIVMRSTKPFELVQHHLRKFIHLYKAETEKWYFFRFYDPQVLVAYLHHIQHSAEKLAAFFGYRDGTFLIDGFGARIGNRFYIFSVNNEIFPENTQPSAVSFDEDFQAFLVNYAKNQFAEKLSTIIIPQEFPSLVLSKENVIGDLEQAMKQGITNEGALELFVKAKCHLLHSEDTFNALMSAIPAQYGKLSELEFSKLLYLNAKSANKKE